VLVVVFQYPPYAGSSAVQRALRFVQHLPAQGWEPVVLTAQPRAYEQVATDLERDLAPGTHVERAFALDAKRHLAWRGRYPGFLAYPDRWRIWQWGARRAGLRLIKRFRPAAIWSTYPIVSAHEIGLHLARHSGLPWIADFRDPMVEEDFPVEPAMRADFAQRELAYSHTAAAFSVTTPGMRDWFIARYPHLGAARVRLIENGYDEGSFARLQPSARGLHPSAFTLLHAGELYPVIRDPVKLFAAARRLIDRGELASGELRFRFRGAGDDSIVARAAKAQRLENFVEILPRVPYATALSEMMAADGLVILQGADCNRQIPAKAYEYLRTGRPLLGITDPAGDTGRTLLAAGCSCVAALDDEDAIAAALGRFVAELRSGQPALPRADVVAAASREARAGELARLLDQVTAGAR
jgi:glycosyltransferase involved in cell wall biosynthesis